jgi:DNA-binding CsgD family transcriptional regulator
MVANFLPVLGVPFLFISWIMLVKMGYSLTDMPAKKSVPVIHLAIFVAVILTVWGFFSFLDKDGLLFGLQLSYAEIWLLILTELTYMGLFAGIVLNYLKQHDRPNRKIIINFVLLMFAGLVVRGTVLPFYFASQWVLVLLILIYFISNFPALFYLRINADLIFTPVHAENPSEEKIAFIFKKYGITKREKEIIEQICQGKTNQQIANDLFISLQTVKDHTHRIYKKIGINSRMKLVQMVNG